MTSATLRAFTTLHTWTGLVAGFALFIAFYAGAITVFHGALHDWEQPALRGEARQTPAHMDALRAAVTEAHPAAREALTVLLPGFDGPRAVAFWQDEASERQSASLDSEGRLAAGAPLDSALAEHINHIHFTLGLPQTAGVWLMGFVCLAYGLALVSGLIIHLPTLVSSLFALRTGRNLKRFWQDAHNVIGVLSLPFHIVFAFTGALLCILALFVAGLSFIAMDERVAGAFQDAFELIETPEPAGAPLAAPDSATLLAHAEKALPGMTPFMLQHHATTDAEGITEVHGVVDGRLANRVAVALRHEDLAVAAMHAPGERPTATAASSVVTSLHFGNFGGPLLAWLYFLLGIAGAFLFYSGNLLWIESRRRRRQSEQPTAHRLMAGLTVGVCIGSCLGISGLFLANKLLPEGLPARAEWELRVYYLLFVGSVVWALLRPPPRAAVELLTVTAVLTAVIAPSNWLITGDLPWTAALQGNWSVAAIDLTALAGAVAFALLARATRRRARHGDPNSVWFLPARTATPSR
jgi:uncharacterized iron-regulated membrane protein